MKTGKRMQGVAVAAAHLALWQRLLDVPRAADRLRVARDHAGLSVDPHREVRIERGDPGHILFILDGWAARYKQSRDGKRQIVGILLPGDLCIISSCSALDLSIEAITRLRYEVVAIHEVEHLARDAPKAAFALLEAQTNEAAILHQWIFNIGQRSALARIAHLLCELFARLKASGLTEGTSCHFPLTQEEIASATGMTAVHVNRTIKDLRRSKLIDLHARRLQIFDWEGLRRTGDFDDGYLAAGDDLP